MAAVQREPPREGGVSRERAGPRERAVSTFVIGFRRGGLVENETDFWSVSRYIQ